jgi:hypothetical protein
MKTIIKNIILPVITASLFSGTAIAQNGSGTNEKMHIKITEEKDGKKVVIDTVLVNPTKEQLKEFNVELPEIPGAPGNLREIPAVPKTPGNVPTPPTPPTPGTKCIRKVVINDNGNGPDTMIIKEVINMTDLENDLKEMGIEISEKDGKRVVIVKNETVTNEGSEEKRKIKFVVRRAMLQDPSAEEKKAQGKNLSGDNKLNVERLDFYPNPNNGKFNLSFNLKDKGDTEVSIFNVEGKKVYTETLKDFSGDYSKAIDLSGSPKGIYFLNVTQGKNNLVKKIVIE